MQYPATMHRVEGQCVVAADVLSFARTLAEPLLDGEASLVIMLYTSLFGIRQTKLPRSCPKKPTRAIHRI